MSLSDKEERRFEYNGEVNGLCLRTEAVKERVQKAKQRFKKNQYLCFNSIMEEEIDKIFLEEFGDKLI